MLNGNIILINLVGTIKKISFRLNEMVILYLEK